MARAGGRPRRRPALRASRAGDVVGGGEFRSGRVVRTGLILGSTFGIKPVQYTVVDGLALFEGDIVLGTEEQLVAQTEHLRAVRTGAVAAGVGEHVFLEVNTAGEFLFVEERTGQPIARAVAEWLARPA